MTTKQKATRLCMFALIAILMIGAAIFGSVTLAYNSASGADAPLAVGETLSALPSASSEDISTRAVGYTAKLTYNAGIVTGVDMTDSKTAANRANLAIVIPATNPLDGTAITKIGDNAFSLRSIYDGRRYTSIDMSIATSLTTIGNYAFEACIGFTGNLTIPGSVTSIGDSAFQGCTKLTSLTIGSGVKTIGDSAFSYCTGFNGNLTIPSGVTNIGNNAFSNCTGFNGNLTISSGVETIGNYAFQDCTGFNGNLTIPSGVTSIGNNAFDDCIGFTGTLTIPNKVTSIGSYAFSGCKGFTGNLTIPDSVTSIGNSAFSGCKGFNGNLTILGSVETIGDSAFRGCAGFTGNLIIGNAVKTIGENAFSNCSGFNGNLTIPSGVETIGNYAFQDCTGFTGGLKIPGSVKTIGDSAFSYCTSFNGNLTIPSGVETIGNYAFRGCTGFNDNLTIPGSVTSIGNNAFFGCKGFTGNLTIPSGVKTIGDNAFYNCSGFTSDLIIPNSVTSIGNNAFSSCRALDTIYLPNNTNTATTYGYNVFMSVACPIVAPNKTIYDNLKSAITYDTLTYATEVTFNAGMGGTIVDGNGATIVQNKLFNLPLNYELNATTNIWAQNTSYTLPTAQRADYIFNGFVDTNGNKLNTTTKVLEESYTASYTAVELESITATNPTKNNYTAFDTFDKTGMVVTATYNDGTSKDLNASDYTIRYTGSNTSFRYGDTTVTIAFTENGVEKTDTVSGITVAKIQLDKPTVSGDYTYIKGTEQTVTLNGFGDTTMNIASGNKATNAGAYTAVVFLADTANYEWMDGTGGDVSLSWTIGKAKLTITPNYDTTAKVFVGGSLPVISTTQSISGAIAWDSHDLSVAVTNKAFGWTWTPTDTENYEVVTGSVNFTVTAVSLESITATFTQGQSTIYATDSLDSLKQYLTVSGLNNDGSSAGTIEDYFLSGDLTAGGSVIITVTYDGKTTTFNVTVTAVAIERISITFNQGEVEVFTSTDINNLKGLFGNALTVTIHYNNGTSVATTEFTLSGDLTQAGESISITAKLDADTTKTANFNIKVSAVALESITATFNQGTNAIYTSATLDDLKQYLTVTGINNDGTAYVGTIEYTLSGTLSAGSTNTITVTVNDKQITTTFNNVTVTAVALESITATFNQGTNAIYTSATLDRLKKYLTVTGLNNDGTDYVGTIEYTLSGTLSAGSTNTITVTVSDKQITTTFNNVTVTAVALESITATFTQGENKIYTSSTLDSLKKYLTVTGLNNDGTDYVGAIDYTLSFKSDSDFAVGSNTVIVTFNGKTAEITVTVTATVLESIAVTTVPDKAAYTAFDDFDKTGMAITATYSHGTAVITDYAIVSGTSLQAGTTTLTISYTYSSVTKTTTVDISVAKASYDLSKITFVDKTIKKNGNTHTIAIMGKLPSGVTVSYTGTNGYVADGIGAAGVYTVTATFTVDDPNNYNIPDAIVATLTINLAEITGGTEDGEDTVIIGGENGIKPGISLIITEKPTLDYKDSNIAVGDVKQTVMQAYDIKLMLGNVAIQPDDNVTVKLLINDSLRGFNELRVMYIGEDGTVTEMNAVREGDYMVFDTTLFSYIYAIVAPTSVATPIIDDGSHCWLIVIAILLLLLILLLLALFLFRKNKEVGFKEYYVSLVDKVKGIFVKNKQFLGTSMESSEEGQDGTEVVAEELEAKKLEEVSETSDSESQEEGTAKAAAGKKPKKKKS